MKISLVFYRESQVKDWWHRVVLYYSWLKQEMMLRELEGVFI